MPLSKDVGVVDGFFNGEAFGAYTDFPKTGRIGPKGHASLTGLVGRNNLFCRKISGDLHDLDLIQQAVHLEGHFKSWSSPRVAERELDKSFLVRLFQAGVELNILDSDIWTLFYMEIPNAGFEGIVSGLSGTSCGISGFLDLWVLPANFMELSTHDQHLTASNDGIDGSAQSSDSGENYGQLCDWAGRFPTALEGLFVFIGILGLGAGLVSVVCHVVYSDSFIRLQWTLLISVVGAVLIIRWVLKVISH